MRQTRDITCDRLTPGLTTTFDVRLRVIPPTLETYRARGHRRLAAQTYETSCSNCLWACRMPVEMIIDHWNPSQKRYRFETFLFRNFS